MDRKKIKEYTKGYTLKVNPGEEIPVRRKKRDGNHLLGVIRYLPREIPRISRESGEVKAVLDMPADSPAEDEELTLCGDIVCDPSDQE